jgi:hypothetical protein
MFTGGGLPKNRPENKPFEPEQDSRKWRGLRREVSEDNEL